MPEFDQLIAAAYQTERVAGRRLAKRAGIDEPQALRLTLEQAAGAQGLPRLLAARAQAREADAARRIQKAEQKAQQRARKTAPEAGAANAWRAWFDGSSHPNPGRVGIGALLAGPGGEQVEISRRAGHGNSGQAEYRALIALLEAAVALRPAELLVYGDSQVVIDDVNRRGARPATGLEDERELVDALIARLGKVSLRWIPRHKNGAADRLSQQAAAGWQAGDAGDDVADTADQP
ncbi:MAG: ribonuclease HI family protein [Burkholderiaceae bacterium]|nr:ribonuclease HI family protein [Burkholderiaceae bacterium]